MDKTSDLSDRTTASAMSSSPETLSRGAEDTNDYSKGHVPYILNGDLYEVLAQEGENVTVKCCNCPPDRVYRGSVRSTGNFHMHIKRRHPELLAQLNEMKVKALLDRRERMGKSRKLRANKGRKQKSAPKNKTKSGNKEVSPPPIVNLKIKTVFQRHQQQAQQQHRKEALKNWDAESKSFAASEMQQSEPLDLSGNTAEQKVEMQVQEDLPICSKNIKSVKTTAHTPEKPQTLKLRPTCGTPAPHESQPQVLQEQHAEDDVVFTNEEPALFEQPMDLTSQSGFRSPTVTPGTYASEGRNCVCTHSDAFTAPLSFESAVMRLNEILIDVQRELLVRNQIELNQFELNNTTRMS